MKPIGTRRRDAGSINKAVVAVTHKDRARVSKDRAFDALDHQWSQTEQGKAGEKRPPHFERELTNALNSR